ncbi:hypothetical protein QL285_083262 [Trifolium repens]|nr:hypothetical protein QL285_083262 [Trifolium repens]
MSRISRPPLVGRNRTTFRCAVTLHLRPVVVVVRSTFLVCDASSLLQPNNMNSLPVARNLDCLLCSSHAEIEAHLFTTCPVAVTVWTEIYKWL